MIHKVFVIANVNAGGGGNAVPLISEILEDAGISYDLETFTEKSDATQTVKRLRTGAYDALLVCSGDGTVLKIGQIVCDSDLPVLILPGGTANALAQTLGQPLSIRASLEAFIEGRYKIEELDVASWNGEPFLFDFHFGLLARTVHYTDRQAKQRFGVGAYLFEGIKQYRHMQPLDLKLEIDGTKLSATTPLCYIANSGLPSLMGFRLFGRKRHTDKQLDVAVLRTTSVGALLWWALQRLLGRPGSQKVVGRYVARTVTITSGPATAFCDDERINVSYPLKIGAAGKGLRVIVPRRKTFRQQLGTTWLFAMSQLYRITDHLRRLLFGMSWRRFSQLSDNLFVGGQPGSGGIKKLQQWGVTAVVSMRTGTPVYVPSAMNSLHLPTRDHAPVALKDLQRGVAFMRNVIAHGGKVYVHCHVGEGRAASMVIAYLIAEGMSLSQAWAYVRARRVFIHPNREQMARLREFARSHAVKKAPELAKK